MKKLFKSPNFEIQKKSKIIKPVIMISRFFEYFNNYRPEFRPLVIRIQYIIDAKENIETSLSLENLHVALIDKK